MTKKLGLLFSTLLFLVVSMFISVNSASADTVTVKMGADSGNPLSFQPKEVTINAGDTVKWVNNKMFPHNVIVERYETDKKFSHKGLAFSSGEYFETKFEQPGVYNYYCEPHRGAGMTGTVTVK